MTEDEATGASDAHAAARERHRRLLEAFWEASELAPQDRGPILDAACAKDPGLRDEIEAMLATHDEDDDDFLESDDLGSSLKRHADAVLRESTLSSPPLPERIGKYRILGLLGEGGMGVVYEAEQERPRRRVALKVLRSTFGSAEILKRFEREVQLLGRLTHPGIAAVHEADWTDGDHSQPYFVMELVEGDCLDDYAAKNQLSLSSKLELLAQLCDAVQHAHEAGVVHRDLKPSNILVTPEGLPKILDFGVARTIDAVVASDMSLHTSTGQLIGTLPYMSPEQATGRPGDVGLHSDIYSLGIVAFELLTGRRPQDLDGLGITEALHAIREAPLSRASTVAPGLPATIDTILGKALEREVGRRYQSMEDVADDIRSFLRDEPIKARPPTISHRARMAARRHRYLLRGAVAVLAVALVASGWILNAMRHERASRIAAERRAYEASIEGAETALGENDSARALQRLDGAPEIHRGFEWDYLKAQSDQRLMTLAGHRAKRIWPRDKGLGVVFGQDTERGLELFEWDAMRDEVVRLGLIGDVRPIEVDPVAVTAVVEFVRFQQGEDWVDVVSPGDTEPHVRVWRCGSKNGPLKKPRRVVGDFVFSDGATWRWREGTPIARKTELIDRAKGLSQDGSFVVGFQRATFRAIDLLTGETLTIMKSAHLRRTLPDFPVRPDGRQFYVATHAPALSLWEPGAAEPLHEIPVAAAKVQGLGLSPDGTAIAVGAMAGTVQVFTGDLTRELALRHAPTQDIARLLFLDQRTLATRSKGGLVSLWDMSADPATVLRGHESYVYDLEWSPDGRSIASCAWDGTVRLWDAATGLETAQWSVGGLTARRLQALAFNLAGDKILVGRGGTHKGSVEPAVLVALDASTLEFLGSTVIDAPPESVEALAGGGWLADGQTQTLQVNPTGTATATLRGSWGMEFDVAPDGRLVASKRDADEIVVWSLATGEQLHVLEAKRVNDLSWNPAQTLLVAALVEGSVRVWDTETWTVVADLDTTSSHAYAVEFNPNGTRLFVGDADGVVHAWETENFAKRLTLRGHASYVKALSISPDGSELASASGDGTVRLWSTHPIGERQLARRSALDGQLADSPVTRLNAAAAFTERFEDAKSSPRTE